MLIYEFIRYFKFADILRSNLKIYKKIIKLFKYKYVSEFRKEKLILNYSKLLFKLSIKIFLILILTIIFIYTLNILFKNFLDLVLSILGIIEISAVLIIYYQFRKKINAKLQ